MKTYNAKNERIKRQYLEYLKEARQLSEPSLDGVAKALKRFEVDTKFRDFQTFRLEQAIAFKRHLSEQANGRTGEPLSKATMLSTLAALRNFFQWLSSRRGYRSHLDFAHADYFNLSEKETRIAKAPRPQRVPTLEQIRHVIGRMPSASDLEKRDRAVIAFTLLTGVRDGALASLKLKHVDLAEGCVVQDAREVRTKFSKSMTTYFFPVGGEIQFVVTEWITFLLEERQWGMDDPLFPSTQVVVGPDQRFAAAGLDRKHWSNATRIRLIFKEAFAAAGLPYFNPHSFRKTLGSLGQKVCRTPESFKAWSQNLGHEQVMTTLTSYGAVATVRQAEIIRGLGKPQDATHVLDALRLAAELVQNGSIAERHTASGC
jgi:integrase